jgi:hypothetical protein
VFQGSCNDVVVLNPEAGNVKTGVRFTGGKILAPLAFSGSYSVMTQCVQFKGTGKATVDLKPGLHVRWPWPVETVARIRPGEVRSVEVGFRSLSEEQLTKRGGSPATSPGCPSCSQRTPNRPAERRTGGLPV